jgi:pimeloyl-ACP methyl ester carboxylesterase
MTMATGLMPAPGTLQAYSREIIVAGGLRLHYYEAGAWETPPLVLIHGLGDDADTWRHVLLPLAERRRVIALDLPGFGRSDRPHRAYTLGFFARSVVALLGVLGIQRAELAGSSLGAAVAQRVALARPALVERLILIGGVLPIERGLPPPRLWWFLTPGVGELAYTSMRRSQDQAYATLRPYYADLDTLPPEDRAFLRERVWARVWNNGQRRAFLSALRWLVIERTLRAPVLHERVVRLAIPTLLIWGDRDQIVPPLVGQRVAALLSNARLHIIERCGHLPQQERPQELVTAITGS